MRIQYIILYLYIYIYIYRVAQTIAVSGNMMSDSEDSTSWSMGWIAIKRDNLIHCVLGNGSYILELIFDYSKLKQQHNIDTMARTFGQEGTHTHTHDTNAYINTNKSNCKFAHEECTGQFGWQDLLDNETAVYKQGPW